MKRKKIFLVLILFFASACGFTAEGKIKGGVNLPQSQETSSYYWSWGWGGMNSGGTYSADGWNFDEKGHLKYEVKKYGRNR